ncbi:P44 outermembrane protein, silent [Anaplasma phagocytophilum]|uniref:p44 outermembrane protein, silent n=1 Tax=Anaplasma phagocytophilum TaxID=948 RepID=A0A098GMI3_ANAPH|nr:P44 outermembrane protein, silent [Anaplasma phagocytophilum]
MSVGNLVLGSLRVGTFLLSL